MEGNKTISKIQIEVSNVLKNMGVESPNVQFVKPPDTKFGDIATNAPLSYAKELKDNPINIAEEIAKNLNTIKEIEKVEVVNPGFVNIHLNNEFYFSILKEVSKNFGKNTSLKKQKWAIEHTSPNPNKALHLGHLRNNLIGMSLVRVIKANGAKVVSDAVLNDRGIAIAKLMWGFLKFMRKGDQPVDVKYFVKHKNEWFTPEEKNLLPDLFINECYVLGEKDSQENDKEIRNLVLKWEEGDKDVWKLWKHTLDYAHKGINRTLNRLGSHWDKVWYEHKHYKKGKEYVLAGLKKGIFEELEDGAVLTKLDEYNIPNTILLKNDGSSLYITQDIALTAMKKKKYKADRLMWVVGSEQSLALKQLFAICEQLEIGKIEEFEHAQYGYVGLKENDSFTKMSSREGNVVLIDQLIDVVKEKIGKEFKDSKDTEKLALAAIKFSFLKATRTQGLTFDIDQSVEITGDSGIYILYTYARIQSLLRKGKVGKKKNMEIGNEKELLKKFIYFGDSITKSKNDLSAHHIAHYLIELCSEFNSWYAKETIIDGTENEKYKLAIAQATGVIIKNGLDLLGIETVDQI